MSINANVSGANFQRERAVKEPVAEDLPVSPAAERANLRDLTERLRAAGVADEGIAEEIARNWQKFAGAVVIALLGIWIWREYHSAQLTTQGEAASSFGESQELFSNFETERAKAQAGDEKAKAETADKDKAAAESAAKAAEEKGTAATHDAKGLKDSLSAIASRHGGTPYGSLAQLYQATVLLESGDSAAAQKLLLGFQVDRFKGSSKLVSAEQEPNQKAVFDEFAALLYARSLLQDPQTRAQGRTRLRELAYAGRVMGVEAVLAFIRSAQGTAEYEEATKLAREIESGLKSSPRTQETAKLLASELEQFGISL